MSKDKDLYLEADNVTYEEEPEEYCKHIFAEALDRNDQLQPLNLINYRFYEGYDERLKERASNTRAKRSSLFVHEVTPAINTRIGQAVSRLEEEESPVTLRPVNDSPTDQEKDDIAWCQRTLNRQLRDCGYLTGGFQEHILGAEIFRTPSTVKVGWQTYSEDEAIRVNPTEYQTEQAVLVGRKVQPKVVWRRVKRGRPYVQWLHTHEFLYEPNVSDFAKESVYAIHGMWLDKNQVVAYAKEYGCDMDAVHAFFDDNDGGSDDGGIATETVQDASQAAEGTPQIESQREGKFSLAEIYVVVYDDDGGQHVD
ncbi:MAG: hypothetical protein U9M89_03360, partial [Patescibacteria group bacterium]|nr:hypothetical protein [Patescibacteria group bacterium]